MPSVCLPARVLGRFVAAVVGAQHRAAGAQQVIADSPEGAESSVEVAPGTVVTDHEVNPQLRWAVRRGPTQRAFQVNAIVRLDFDKIGPHETLTRSSATVSLYSIKSRSRQ